MARIVVISASLDDVIERTDPQPNIRWCTPTDRDALVLMGISAGWLDGALDGGAMVAVVEERGAVVAYCGFSLVEELKLFDWLTVKSRPQQDIVAVTGFVDERHRGRRLLPNIEGFAARYFSKLGYRRMIGVIEMPNEASIKAHAHVGAIPIMKFSRVRIGNLITVWQGASLRHFSCNPHKPFVLSV